MSEAIAYRSRSRATWDETRLTESWADRKPRVVKPKAPKREEAYPLRGVSPSDNLCDVDNRYLSLYRGLVPVPLSRRWSWRDDAVEVAAKHGLTVGELLSRSRTRHIARPRQELMWRLYSTGRITAPRIGQLLGGYDHSTVLHGVREHQKRISEGLA